MTKKDKFEDVGFSAEVTSFSIEETKEKFIVDLHLKLQISRETGKER